MRHALLLATCIFVGCGDAPQQTLDLSLLAQGTAVSDHELETDLLVTLSRADLAFGPLFLCPGSQAGDLCDSARMEWLDSAVVDALESTPQDLGSLVGVTGSTRSWMFDYGISSLLTKSEPLPSPAAEALDGASLILEGEFAVAGTNVPFVAHVIVQQGEETEQGIPVMRKSTSDEFEHELGTSDSSLTVRWDPSTWFSSLHAEDICPEGLCPDEITWEADSRMSIEIAQAMLGGKRPTFAFD